MNRGTCKSCGKPVLWVQMENGKAMPIDADSIERRVVLDGAKEKGAIRSTGISHFATCPDAAKHRRSS